MGKGRLTQIEGGGEVADTDRFPRALEVAHHLQGRGVGQRLEPLDRLVHFGDRHRHRRWATDPFDALRGDGFHARSLSVPLTTVYGSGSLPSTDVNLLREGDMDTIRESVRAKYAQTAITLRDGGSCCDPSCCGGSDAASGPIAADEYSKAEVEDLGLSLGASLGCGNPTALAQLHPGEIVLDLGSGAGLDVLLSARRVSPGGHAYGVDMTDEMLALANENKARAGVANASFLKGTIEEIPLPAAAVDVVISNCVINLAADKTAVLKEAFRDLRPSGRPALSDMVELEPHALHVKSAMDPLAGCVAGTNPGRAHRV